MASLRRCLVAYMVRTKLYSVIGWGGLYWRRGIPGTLFTLLACYGVQARCVGAHPNV